MATPTPDFRVTGHGSLVAFEPVTPDAQDFVRNALAVEGWQWLGPRFHVDHRPAEHLIDQLEDAGFFLEKS